jgi:hypothetical protein
MQCHSVLAKSQSVLEINKRPLEEGQVALGGDGVCSNEVEHGHHHISCSSQRWREVGPVGADIQACGGYGFCPSVVEHHPIQGSGQCMQKGQFVHPGHEALGDYGGCNSGMQQSEFAQQSAGG